MISRQDKLKNIISNNKIYTQAELVEALNNEGYDVTQATISRDIHNLNIIKVRTDDGRSYYALKEKSKLPEHFLRVLKDGYIRSDLAMNILVVKTVSGLAMAVAAAIDAIKFEEVVGCIAGDDTIFVAASDINSAKSLKRKIEDLL